jgi:hypothetical protein
VGDTDRGAHRDRHRRRLGPAGRRPRRPRGRPLGGAAAERPGRRPDRDPACELEAQQQRAVELQQRFAQESAARSQVDLQHAIETLVAVAGERFDARSASGAADLDGKKALIDAELERVGTTLGRITEVVQQLERDRADQLGQVTQQLHSVTRCTVSCRPPPARCARP